MISPFTLWLLAGGSVGVPSGRLLEQPPLRPLLTFDRLDLPVVMH